MLRAHLVAPLLLFSTMGPWHIRVLEAYFNGNKLVVRNTDLIDLRDKNDTVLKNLLRWWFGAGIGDTTVLPTKSRA
ncbi:uncharacterized protein N7459_006469 [Penicillium hispanicum]|uniref:uncharacterized protein n=1 Tax=Penicillium hispanicum TaxID=1080232 RepID=UPI0025403856|nr:uncharacterized protein N7459_006469 [Penicillium hispanicum]KAJ5577505.1 hypothetical protein N7459_006469 [Penicillium hispanicum]